MNRSSRANMLAVVRQGYMPTRILCAVIPHRISHDRLDTGTRSGRRDCAHYTHQRPRRIPEFIDDHLRINLALIKCRRGQFLLGHVASLRHLTHWDAVIHWAMHHLTVTSASRMSDLFRRWAFLLFLLLVWVFFLSLELCHFIFFFT